MMHRGRLRLIPLIAILFETVAQSQTPAPADNIGRAIAFLNNACITSGSALDIRTTSNGSLQITDANRATVVVSKKEIAGLADTASELNARQASEMRACMKPYIDKIVSSLLGQNAQGAPQDVVIATSGYPFKVEEFDRLIALMATRGTDEWRVSDIKSRIKLSAAKVDLYMDIAGRNQLMFRFENEVHMYPKGLAYAISRDLIR